MPFHHYTMLGAAILAAAAATGAWFAGIRLRSRSTAVDVPAQSDAWPAPRRLRQLQPASAGGGDAHHFITSGSSTFLGQVEEHLERAFHLHERGRISLDTYCGLLLAEQEAASLHIARLRAGIQHGDGDSSELETQLTEAEKAMAAIDWCMNWAKETAAG